MTRTLVVIRHAKAESFAASDDARVLTPSGHRDAHAAGAWLAARGIIPDSAHVSDAARTRETWRDLAAGAGWTLAPQIEGALYDTDETGVLELVHAVPDDVRTVVVVGHNPTMASLAQLLDDGAGPGSAALTSGSFPTSSVAVFEVAGSWHDIGPMQGRLIAFHVARADDAEEV